MLWILALLCFLFLLFLLDFLFNLIRFILSNRRCLGQYLISKIWDSYLFPAAIAPKLEIVKCIIHVYHRRKFVKIKERNFSEVILSFFRLFRGLGLTKLLAIVELWLLNESFVHADILTKIIMACSNTTTKCLIQLISSI